MPANTPTMARLSAHEATPQHVTAAGTSAGPHTAAETPPKARVVHATVGAVAKMATWPSKPSVSKSATLNIVGAIANEAGLEGKHIGHVDIRDDHTFIDLPEGMPRDIFRSLQKVRVVGQELRISRVDGKPPRQH